MPLGDCKRRAVRRARRPAVRPRSCLARTLDPTLISSRYFTEFNFESYDGDGDLYKNEHTLRWGIPWRDGHAFGIQAMLPVKWREVAGDEEFGLGDLELRTGIVGRLAPTLRHWANGRAREAASRVPSAPRSGRRMAEAN